MADTEPQEPVVDTADEPEKDKRTSTHFGDSDFDAEEEYGDA